MVRREKGGKVQGKGKGWLPKIGEFNVNVLLAIQLYNFSSSQKNLTLNVTLVMAPTL